MFYSIFVSINYNEDNTFKEIELTHKKIYKNKSSKEYKTFYNTGDILIDFYAFKKFIHTCKNLNIVSYSSSYDHFFFDFPDYREIYFNYDNYKELIDTHMG